ncbi:hypothetical protein [Actinomadura madurae]|uniref:hypothetical protein n=1 Tax=Actinomadura madurae TaxID=1993 RepID=UPI0032B04495
MQTTRSTVRDDILRAVGDAVWAPSVHNTQPWRFGVAGTRISLRADPDRRLDVADPDGREMLISCGAALYTLRLSLRALGYAPVVTVLPDPARPHLLADVDLEPGEPADRQTLLAHAQIARRRSHRGGFLADPVPPEVVAAMRYDAGHEGARLIEAVDPHVTNALAALTDAAEHVQRRSPAYAAEIARWAPSPRTSRQDGVQERAYPRTVPQTTPDFPARDFARGHGWGCGARRRRTRPEWSCSWSPVPTRRPTGCGRGRRSSASCCGPRRAGSRWRSTPRRSRCPNCASSSARGSARAATRSCCSGWASPARRRWGPSAGRSRRSSPRSRDPDGDEGP